MIFQSDREGRVELIVSPLQKLTPRKGIKVEDLGTPEQLLPRIGNYITGGWVEGGGVGCCAWEFTAG